MVATIRDAGAGFQPEAVCEGRGLKGMAERLATYGGEVSIESAPGEGTCGVHRLAAADPERQEIGNCKMVIENCKLAGSRSPVACGLLNPEP